MTKRKRSSNGNGSNDLDIDIEQQNRSSLGKSRDYITERTRWIHIQAESAELRLRKERGLMIDLSTHMKGYHDTIRPIVTKLFGLPRKLAPRLARETDPGKCEEILREGLEETLEGIANAEAIEESMAKAGVRNDLGIVGASAAESDSLETTPEADSNRMGRRASRTKQRGKRKSRKVAH